MDRVIETNVSIRVGRGMTKEGESFVMVVPCDNRGALMSPIAFAPAQALSLSWQIVKAAFSGWGLF